MCRTGTGSAGLSTSTPHSPETRARAKRPHLAPTRMKGKLQEGLHSSQPRSKGCEFWLRRALRNRCTWMCCQRQGSPSAGHQKDVGLRQGPAFSRAPSTLLETTKPTRAQHGADGEGFLPSSRALRGRPVPKPAETETDTAQHAPCAPGTGQHPCHRAVTGTSLPHGCAGGAGPGASSSQRVILVCR